MALLDNLVDILAADPAEIDDKRLLASRIMKEVTAAGYVGPATIADRPRAEEGYEIDPPLTTAQAVQVQTVINIAIMRDRADREKDEPHPEPSNDAAEVEVGKIATGEDAHGLYASGGYRVPADQLYVYPPVTVPRGGMIFGGAQVTATDQPVVIDSLAELRELDSIDLRLWFHSTRKLLTVLGYPRERLNQIVTETIFAEED